MNQVANLAIIYVSTLIFHFSGSS